jgi:hypothetical protein
LVANYLVEILKQGDNLFKRHKMHVSAINPSLMTSSGLTPANGSQFGDLLQGFRLALEGARTPLTSLRGILPAWSLPNPPLPPWEPTFTLVAGDLPTAARELETPATALPLPANPPTKDASVPAGTLAEENRVARIRAALALASGPAPMDSPYNPGGMANGSTVSLLARGFVKFAPGLGQDRPQASLSDPAEPGDLRKVDRIAQIALGLNSSSNAPTPDLTRADQASQPDFPETAEAIP